MSEDEIRAEYITFTAATLDGVAAFISPFVDNMLQHPTVRQKMLAEIDMAEANGSLSSPIAKFDEITALPYFQACILENLRHDAPAQTILPRLVSAGGIEYQGSFIPPGTEMAASPYLIHRTTEIFGADADDFRPERWLEDPAQAARMEKYGMWWGYGDRRCVGENFAQLEMQKLCFQLFREFDIQVASPDKPYEHERWAVGMFWNQFLSFRKREKIV